MVEAYIMIQTVVGQTTGVAKEISAIEGVTQADNVTGPYDVIVRAQADDVDALGLLVGKIQQLQGIERTLTCPIGNI